jgi:membrane fusion protein (multidrug efflux system)
MPEHEGEGEAAEVRKPSPLKNPKVRLALAAGVVVVAVGGGIWLTRHLTYGRYQQSTDDAYIQADVVAVSPRIAGTIDGVMVVENQWVRAGQPLVRISSRDYASRRNEAQAQAEAGAAGVRAAQAAIAEQQATVTQTEAQLAAARVDLAYAEGEVRRYAPLAATGAEADVQYDQLRNNRDKAAAEVRSRAAALAVQQQRVQSLTAQRDQSVAQQRSSEAQVATAQVDVDASLLRASTRGRIGDLTARVGQTVQPGTRLMSIVPTEAIYVLANFKETQMGLVRPGQPVSIEVDALPQAHIRGVVDSTSPATNAQFALIPPQNATGNFTKVVQRLPVRVRLDAGPEARKFLVAGLSVKATIDTRGARESAKQIDRESEARKH